MKTVAQLVATLEIRVQDDELFIRYYTFCNLQRIAFAKFNEKKTPANNIEYERAAAERRGYASALRIIGYNGNQLQKIESLFREHQVK